MPRPLATAALCLAALTAGLASRATGKEPLRLLDAPLVVDGRATMALFGAVLFRAPEILSREAQTLGLSCQSCHPNGAANRTFTLPGRVAPPGTVDLEARALGGDDDQRALATPIPGLRGSAQRTRFGARRGTGDLGRYIERHVVEDLGGDPLDPFAVFALTRFVESMAPLPRAFIDERGALKASAPAAVRRGAAAFEKARKGLEGRACATCHVAQSAFADGRVWAHGPETARHVRTPTLVGLTEKAAFFVDGRAATLAAVVADYDARFALKLTAGERADLVAYLEAISGAPVTDERSVESSLRDRFQMLAVVVDPRVDEALCAQALTRVDEALGERPPPPRIAFKVDGARARVRTLRERCADEQQDARLEPEVARLVDDLTRLATEWQDAHGQPSAALPDDAVR